MTKCSRVENDIYNRSRVLQSGANSDRTGCTETAAKECQSSLVKSRRNVLNSFKGPVGYIHWQGGIHYISRQL